MFLSSRNSFLCWLLGFIDLFGTILISLLHGRIILIIDLEFLSFQSLCGHFKKEVWQPKPSLICRPSCLPGSNRDAQRDADTDIWYPYLSSAGQFLPNSSQGPWDGCLTLQVRDQSQAELRAVINRRRDISFVESLQPLAEQQCFVCVCGFPSWSLPMRGKWTTADAPECPKAFPVLLKWTWFECREEGSSLVARSTNYCSFIAGI